MSNKENGGPAFSGTYSARSDQGRGPVVEIHDKGMSLRDYFAAKAIQGMFANDSLLKRYAEDGMVNMVSPEVLATTAAYSIADAMLAERAK